MPVIEDAVRLAKTVPVGRARTVAAYTCAGLALVCVATLLYAIVAFIYFRFTGELLGDFTAQDMEWAQMGYGLVGTGVIAGLSGTAAIYLLPDEPEDAVEAATALPTGRHATRPEAVETTKPQAPSTSTATPAEPVGSARAWSPKVAAQNVRRAQARQEHEQDEEKLLIVRSDPQLAAVADLLEELLLEQESRALLQAEKMEQRSKSRDRVFLGVGILAGVVSPVISSPLYRFAPF